MVTHQEDGGPAAALRHVFERDGVVRVAGAIAPDHLGAMRDCARERIAPLEFVEITGALRPARGTELALWAIGREPAFASLPDSLVGAVDRVFGPGVWAQAPGELGGLAMPNLPCPGAPWRVCNFSWHVDEPTPPGHEPGRVLLCFACLDLVEPGGGGTIAIAGSPRRLAALADQLRAPVTTDVALAALARDEPWFADRFRTGDSGDADRGRLPEGCVSAGIPVRVVELTGEPGDVVLMDPRCLHTTSPNVSARPRLIMRQTFMRA